MQVWGWLAVALILLALVEIDPGTAVRLLLLALAGLGGWLLVQSARRLGRARREAAVELSARELLVGQALTVRLRADGQQAPTGGLRARLICREAVTYRPSGQPRSVTDAHEWIVQEAERDRSDGAALALAIPPDAMHSVRTRRHEVGWRLEVETGRADRLDLPITVLPGVYAP